MPEMAFASGQFRTDNEKRKFVKETIIEQMVKYYPNNIEKIDSLKEFSIKLGYASKNRRVSAWLKDEIGIELFTQVFTKRQTTVANIKRQRMFNVLDIQFEQFMRDDIDNFYSIGEMARILGSSRKSVREWVGEFLLEKFGSQDIAAQMKEDIWLLKSTAANKMKYEHLEEALPDGFELITTQEEFDDMQEIPSMRDIEYKCIEGHINTRRTSVLLYKGFSCSHCVQYKCQEIMRLYMEKILKVSFPHKTFTRAFNIPWNQHQTIIVDGTPQTVAIGRLEFDGFNARVEINGKIFSIAFEYDGRHHDDEYHYYYTRFNRDYGHVRAADSLKNSIAKNRNIIIIRLKEVRDFDIEHVNLFQDEIIRQIEQQTGEKLGNIPRYTYDAGKKRLISTAGIDNSDNFLGNR